MGIGYRWIVGIVLWLSGMIYGGTMERREDFRKRLIFCAGIYVTACVITSMLFVKMPSWLTVAGRLLGFFYLICFLYICWNVTWSVATYYSVWGYMSWQLLYEVFMMIEGEGKTFFQEKEIAGYIICGLVFAVGYLAATFTIARWMPEEGQNKIGPRQLVSALVIFLTFETVGFAPGNIEMNPGDGRWAVLYLTQIMLALILYLQSELFKKSMMRQELAAMNMLWKKEKEQYQLSKENITLINQKCHDLKHQIRAIRNMSKEEIDTYLEEMEDSIRIYEAIVKTGNEVLDTILTEKSLICKERGITVSCVADGSQMDFINTIDLYAILGNALDNAMEAVEKFKHQEKRQIDVMIYRQQNFLVMNIINPIKGNLVYEEELPVSTKGDNRFHGFGLKSMRYIVKKYDGFLNVSEEDGCFSLKILIPIPKST